jgi:hypothetical protein
LHYSPFALSQVDATRIGAQVNDWGRYYDKAARYIALREVPKWE